MSTYVYVLDGWDDLAQESICRVYKKRPSAQRQRLRVINRRFKSAKSGRLYLGVIKRKIR
jgi:hypothetical protein